MKRPTYIVVRFFMDFASMVSLGKEKGKYEKHYVGLHTIFLQLVDCLRISLLSFIVWGREKDELIKLLDDALIEPKRDRELRYSLQKVTKYLYNQIAITTMTKEEIESLINFALESLNTKQPNLFAFTAQTGQTEWNLAHHLAIELHALLPTYDCDLDVTKHEYGNMRPDIIFHRRGTNEENLLVIETKFKRNERAIQDDIDKIKNVWFTGNLRYQFGASINLHDGRPSEITVLQNY